MATLRRSDGMTWTALVVLLAVLAFLGWNVWIWNDARTPPDGASVRSATVDDVADPSRPRPGTRNPSTPRHVTSGSGAWRGRQVRHSPPGRGPGASGVRQNLSARVAIDMLPEMRRSAAYSS